MLFPAKLALVSLIVAFVALTSQAAPTEEGIDVYYEDNGVDWVGLYILSDDR